MILNQIVAVDQNLGIGKDNQLLWHFSEDLKFFKKTTLNKVLIMGRKTLDSILSISGKPLPQRFHIVLSRQPQKQIAHENIAYVTSIEEAYQKAQSLIVEKNYPQDVFIIGGAEIYKQTLQDCKNLYITQIKGNYHADAFYPSEYQKSFQMHSQEPSETQSDLTFQVWIKTPK